MGHRFYSQGIIAKLTPFELCA